MAQQGRPALFESEEDLQKKIDDYFAYVKGEKKEGMSELVWERAPEPATITGLALFLGFESRQSFYDYENNERFSYTIKKARLRVENEYEKNLSSSSPTGSIFALKNLGWKDKVENEVFGKDGGAIQHKTVHEVVFKKFNDNKIENDNRGIENESSGQ